METEESSPHLHWKWNYGKYNNLYYSFFIIILILLSTFGLENGYILATLSTVSFFISKKIYTNTHSVGNMWCFAAAFCPWILVGLNSI